jgi:hypothetical protein
MAFFPVYSFYLREIVIPSIFFDFGYMLTYFYSIFKAVKSGTISIFSRENHQILFPKHPERPARLNDRQSFLFFTR